LAYGHRLGSDDHRRSVSGRVTKRCLAA
jgi:hypothetical protein